MKNDMENNKKNAANDLSGQILEKIQKERLTPRSRLRFLFHDYFVWALSFFAVTLGSISFGIFLLILSSNDWDIYEKLGTNKLFYILSVIPYLFVIFVAAFIFYANYFFNQTNRGYRYKRAGFVVGSISVSAILGVFLYYFGTAQLVDDYFTETVPCYHQLNGNHVGLWLQSEKGLLAGTILATTSDGFYLTDFDEHEWVIINMASSSQKMTALVQKGARIKIIGSTRIGDIVTEEVKDEDKKKIFYAQELRPWVGEVEPCGMCSILR